MKTDKKIFLQIKEGVALSGSKTLLLLFIILPAITFAIVKNSTANGQWSNPLTWNPTGVPSTGDKIYINHVVNLDQNFTVSDTIFVLNTLNLSTNRTLSLSPGTMVLVNNVNHSGTIGTVGLLANIVGDFIFQKWINRCDGFSTYGSPFNVAASDFSWYYCNQCMPSWSNLYYYDETVPGVQENGYYDNIGGNIVRGRGFSYWYSNYAGGKNFSRQISLKGSIDFTTDFNFNVSRTVSNGISHDGYNLISNPFPGTIDWLSNAWTKTSMLNAIYVWNTCTDSYASYVSGVGVNGGSRYIPSMQGFWVQATGINPKLSIKSGALTNVSQNLQKSDSHTDSVNFLLRLKLNGDEIAIRLNESSTDGMDSLTDAVKFFSANSTLCSVNGKDSINYAINSIADKSNIIKIKIRGGGTLKFNGIPSFFGEYDLYMKDTYNGSYNRITEGLEYNFSDTSLVTFNSRFEIHFIKQNVTGLRNEIADFTEVKYDSENISIKFGTEFSLPANIKMFDLSGSLLYSTSTLQNEVTIPKSNVPALLRINNQYHCVVKKIF